MRWISPHIDVPGDNPRSDDLEHPGRIMARSGDFLGGNERQGAWRFGFGAGSESAEAYGVHFTGRGFLWVLATRKTGKVLDTCEGFAVELPETFTKVIDG